MNTEEFYQVADGSSEYRNYADELSQFIDESSEDIVPRDYWFDYDLMQNRDSTHSWCLGQYGSVECNPDFDQYDGNF